jgi:hypothetical protein
MGPRLPAAFQVRLESRRYVLRAESRDRVRASVFCFLLLLVPVALFLMGEADASLAVW